MKTVTILIGFLLICGGLSMVIAGIKIDIKKILPPGYTMLCNDAGKYKWFTTDWTQGGGGSSKQDAINNAWLTYKGGTFTESNCE